jgi:hypothetical protein
MKMNKVIKEIKENEYIYQLGYNLWDNKVYPRLETYKIGKLVFGFSLSPNKSFSIGIYHASSYIYGNVDTIKEIFEEIKNYYDIPKEIEKEYESIFLLYKMNDFKKI